MSTPLRKRKHSSADISKEPPKKKAKADAPVQNPEVSSSTFERVKDDVQTPEGMLKYQNAQLGETVVRQRRTIQELEHKVKQAGTEKLKREAELSVVRRHWDSLDGELKIILSRLDPTFGSGEALPSEDPSEDETNFRLRLLRSLPEAFDDMEAGLVKKCAFTKDVLSRVAGALEKAQQANLAPDASAASALVDAMEVKHREAVAKAEALADSVASLSNELDATKNELATTRNSLDAAYRKLDRVAADLTKQRERAKNGVVEPKEELGEEEEQTEMEILQELADNRLKELESMKEEQKKLATECKRLKDKPVVEMQNEQVTMSRLYKDLYTKWELTNKEHSNSQQEAKHLQRELTRVVMERKQHEEKYQAMAARREEGLAKEVKDAAQMMERYKSERNALSYRLHQKDGIQTDAKLLAEYKTMIKSQKAENLKLKREMERYKAIIPQLKKRVQSINEELLNEPHKLPVNGKYTAEELYKRLSKADRAVRDLQEALKTQKIESHALFQEIEVIGKAFETMQEQNARLLRQLSDKEDASAELMSDRIKARQLEGVVKEQKRVLHDKNHVLEERLSKQSVVIEKLQARMKTQDELLEKTKQANFSLEMGVEEAKRKARDFWQSAREYHSQLEHAQQSLQECKSKGEQKAAGVHEERHKIRRLEEESESLKRKLSRTKSSGEIDSELVEQVNGLRSLITCTVCNVRQKSVIITRCHHTFCRECIDDNIKARNRKCPVCSKLYQKTDVNPVFL